MGFRLDVMEVRQPTVTDIPVGFLLDVMEVKQPTVTDIPVGFLLDEMEVRQPTVRVHLQVQLHEVGQLQEVITIVVQHVEEVPGHGHQVRLVGPHVVHVLIYSHTLVAWCTTASDRSLWRALRWEGGGGAMGTRGRYHGVQ